MYMYMYIYIYIFIYIYIYMYMYIPSLEIYSIYKSVSTSFFLKRMKRQKKFYACKV